MFSVVFSPGPWGQASRWAPASAEARRSVLPPGGEAHEAPPGLHDGAGQDEEAPGDRLEHGRPPPPPRPSSGWGCLLFRARCGGDRCSAPSPPLQRRSPRPSPLAPSPPRCSPLPLAAHEGGLLPPPVGRTGPPAGGRSGERSLSSGVPWGAAESLADHWNGSFLHTVRTSNKKPACQQVPHGSFLSPDGPGDPQTPWCNLGSSKMDDKCAPRFLIAGFLIVGAYIRGPAARETSKKPGKLHQAGPAPGAPAAVVTPSVDLGRGAGAGPSSQTSRA